MKDWVERKLDELDILFPQERMLKSKNRIRAMWQHEQRMDRYPFTYSYATFNPYNAQHEAEERLRFSLDEFIIHGNMRDDFIPAFFPGCRHSTIPSMFGAREKVMGDETSCERLIWNPEDIDHLPEPSIQPGSPAARWLAMQRYFLEETDGRLPVHVIDMQGPFDVCAQMMSYDSLFLMAYEDPERLRSFLSKVAEAFVLLWKTQKALLGDLFVGTHLFAQNWVPEDFGATLSADSLVMFGPDFYNEFVKPIIEMLADRLGTLTVHSCGNFAHNVRALCKTRGVCGINASQMSIATLFEAGADRETVIISMIPYQEAADSFAQIKRHGLHVDTSIDGMPWPMNGSSVKPIEAWTNSDWKSLRLYEEKILKSVEI